MPAVDSGLDRSVDPAEVARFSALAEEWWNPDGPFRPLHRLNPVRLGFIRDRAMTHFGREAIGAHPLADLAVLDIGCGGGLLCEPLSRLGANVIGIDASARNISIAAHHAVEMDLPVGYRQTTAEALAETVRGGKGRRYDIVLAMEIVEHVADLRSFAAAAASLVAPGGLMIASTLNRTPKSYLMAILGAEYLLRWLPRGTHDWRKFVRPSELAALCRDNGLHPREMAGVAFNPLADSWRLAPRDLDVNYMMLAARPA